MTTRGAHRTRRMAILLGLVLAALTALAVWVSGRWLERPHRPPGSAAGTEKAQPPAGAAGAPR